MSSIPSNLARVPTSLASTISLNGITRVNSELLTLNEQMSTFRRVNRPSDDPVAASLVSVLDASLEHDEQLSRNLSHASSVLGTIDQRIGSLNDAVLEAKSIASSQLGAGSDASTRAQQATVVDALIDQVFATMNSDFAGVSLFSGGMTSVRSVEVFNGGYRYAGDRGGLQTEIGHENDFPITLSADEVVGSLSARVRGDVDLDPDLTADTRLADLRGPMSGAGALGVLTVTVDTGVPADVSVDLSEAETVGDVADLIESAVRDAGHGAAFSAGYPGGVTVGADQLVFNLAGAATLAFSDGPIGRTASALGVGGLTYTNVVSTNTAASADLDPRVTDRTLLGSMSPATALDFDDITITNGSKSGTVTTNAGMTVGEFREAVRRLDLGVRVEIDEDGSALNIVNEVAGARLSVSEGGGTAATTLGIRSMSATTPTSAFNDGRGVDIADGATLPGGAPDTGRNTDFEVTLSDGTSFTVDLTPADVATVADVIAKINADAAAAGITVGGGAGEFQAALDATSNGLVLEDRLGGAAPVSVRRLNGFAAEDLGLLGGTSTAGTPARLVGEDRATVRVDSLFTTLLDLRDAMLTDDERGMTFAGERLETDLDRLTSARALVGGRAQRVESSVTRLEDRVVLDQSIKSELQDLDYVSAASRLSLLDTQLQASLAATARVNSLTLLNFL